MRILYIFIILALMYNSCHQSGNDGQPNVILILTDDQGYGDVGYHGNPDIITPTIDSLAMAGIRFTDFYVSPRCAPSRAALMTGRYPEKTGVFHVTDGGYNMAAGETTMAEYFKNAGYRTAIFGKWHIGDHYPYLPRDQGFDFSLIHKGGAIGQIADHPDNYWDMTKPLSERKQSYFNTTLYKNRQVYKAEGYVADVFTDHALQFIEDHHDQPFFVYLPYNTPHDPYQVPGKYLEKYKDLPYHPVMDTTNSSTHRLNDYRAAQYVYAMMTNMDDNINRIVRKLEEKEIADNSIIVFLSDNGPAQFRFKGNLRGKKGQVFEGGIRVPAFINYTGLKAQQIDVPAAHYDILPSLARFCDLQLGENIDGIDLSPFFGNPSKENPERSVIIRETSYLEPYKDIMIRKGDFKLVAFGGKLNPEFHLFNLQNDPYEENDVINEFPEKAEELKIELDKWYNEVLKSDHLKILPVTIGSQFENPVRLSRHELVTSYASGWFSKQYLGFYSLKVANEGNYDVKLTFRDTIRNPGSVNLKMGPVGRKIAIDEVPETAVAFDDIYLTPGEYTLQTWFQNRSEVISPFYVDIEKLD